MGGVGRMASQGLLVREACIGVLVGGVGSLLSGVNEVSISEFWGIYGLDVTLGSLYFNAQGCVPALLEN